MKKVMRIASLALLTGILFSSCDKLPIHFPPGGGGGSNSFKEIIYVESNDTTQNAILAYVNNGDGKLQQLPGSPFNTGGTGFRYNVRKVHANASDNEIIFSNDLNFCWLLTPDLIPLLFSTSIPMEPYRLFPVHPSLQVAYFR